MDFDRYEQDGEELERQVNKIFDDMSGKSVKQRMAIATFDLMNHIDEERVASQEVWKAWAEHGRSNGGKSGRFVNLIIIGLGSANVFSAEVPTNSTNKHVDGVQAKTSAEEVAAMEERLQLAQTAMQHIRSLMPSVYGLRPRHIKRVEAKARKLQTPANL